MRLITEYFDVVFKKEKSWHDLLATVASASYNQETILYYPKVFLPGFAVPESLGSFCTPRTFESEISFLKKWCFQNWLNAVKKYARVKKNPATGEWNVGS